MPGVFLSSWRDERLPEVLWAAILTAALDRESYLEIFREVAKATQNLETSEWIGLGHSRLAGLSNQDFDSLLAPILNSENSTLLKPLRLFKELPDRNHWARHIEGWDTSELEDYNTVAAAIGLNSWHQSQSATDIRWLRVLSMVEAGRMHFVEGMEQQREEIRGYPEVGDMRAVRPSIRAAEQAFVTFDEREGRSNDWIDAFWRQCKLDTGCFRARPKRPERRNLDEMFKQAVNTYKQAEDHFHTQVSHAAVDARLDGVFGLSLYALTLFLTMIAGHSSRRVEGRIILRTLAETYITLAYLLRVEAEATWKQYRVYGQGQAKLAYLKSLDLSAEDKAKYVSEEDLEFLTNEDKWEEFVDIDLKSWSGNNVRSMSEKAGVKNIYDKYFIWPSGYVHAHWGSVRDTVFDLCLNPLHRLHRIPATPRANMTDCTEDASKLVNLTLDLLNKAYPTFKARIRV